MTIKDIIENDPHGLLANDDDSGVLDTSDLPDRKASATSYDYYAKRTQCENFATYKDQFESIKEMVKEGRAEIYYYGCPAWTNDLVKHGNWFIAHGQIAYIAGMGDWHRRNGRKDRRLTVIYENETQSNILRSTFIKNLRQGNGRFIL